MATCNLHGDCGCECKVYTHADHKALEERSEYFRKEWNKAEGEIERLTADDAVIERHWEESWLLCGQGLDEAIDKAIARSKA